MGHIIPMKSCSRQKCSYNDYTLYANRKYYCSIRHMFNHKTSSLIHWNQDLICISNMEFSTDLSHTHIFIHFDQILIIYILYCRISKQCTKWFVKTWRLDIKWLLSFIFFRNLIIKIFHAFCNVFWIIIGI